MPPIISPPSPEAGENAPLRLSGLPEDCRNKTGIQGGGEGEQKETKGIGYIDMVGDLFHIGHIDLIEYVHNLGYRVIVGVHSDEDVAQYKRKPILSMEERAKPIRTCKFVAEVVEGAPLFIDADFIEKHSIDMVFHSHDEDDDFYNQMYRIPIGLNKFTRTERRPGISTTSIIGRVAHRSRDWRTMRTDALKDALRNQTRTLRIMETHSGITGMIAERTLEGGNRFDGMWSSSLTASLLKGRPDIEVVDTTSRLQIVKDTLNATKYLPLIYDGDTGGSKEIFFYTIRDLEDTGASACIIEDKTGLKQNSLFGTDRVQILEDIDTFCAKIQSGIKARKNPNFMIIARIEALIAGAGQAEAIKRARAYIDAGADAIMIHSKQKTFNEIKNFMDEYNQLEKRVPVVAVPSSYDTVTEAQLWESGINICIYANHAFRASFKAMETVASSILANGCGYPSRPHLTSIKRALVLLDGEEPRNAGALESQPKVPMDDIVDLIKKQHGLVVGVPDSALKTICNKIAADPTIPSIVAVNEGAAVSMAAGWAMATKGVPLVYMQNSGLGNAVNPLTSLVHGDVYSIPMVLMIGWRGAPGKKDEPQHMVMGNCTKQMLELMSIPSYEVTSHNVLDVLRNAHATASKESKAVCVLVRPGTLPAFEAAKKESSGITRGDALECVLGAVGDEDVLVCTTGFTSREMLRIREARQQRGDLDFLCVGSMGHASSIAQGIALAQPTRTVWCIDGDGAQLMHLGAMTGGRDFGLPNLRHVTLNNRMHESVGSTSTASETVSLAKIAAASGYAYVKKADTTATLAEYLGELRQLSTAGYVEVSTCINCGNDGLPRPKETPLVRRERFVEALSKPAPARTHPLVACSETGDKLLLTPGPLTTRARVKEAMLTDVGSRSAGFAATLQQVQDRVLSLVGCSKETHACLPLPGSGTYGVEAMLGLVSTPTLLCINGQYGERMLEMCKLNGIPHEVYREDYNRPLTVQGVLDKLCAHSEIENVAFVHLETTTGVLNPMKEIVDAVRSHNRYRIFVDAMSSIAAVPLDASKIDGIAFSSNKGIEGPPGMALLVVDNALIAENEGTPSRTLSLDLRRHMKYLQKSGQCQFTPPTHVVLGLNEALSLLLEEGAEKRQERFSGNMDVLCTGMKTLGFEPTVPAEHQSPVIANFQLGSHKFEDLYEKLDKYGYSIYEGKIEGTFRIGCMGVTNGEMKGFVDAFAHVLNGDDKETVCP